MEIDEYFRLFKQFRHLAQDDSAPPDDRIDAFEKFFELIDRFASDPSLSKEHRALGEELQAKIKTLAEIDKGAFLAALNEMSQSDDPEIRAEAARLSSLAHKRIRASGKEVHQMVYVQRETKQ